MAKKKHSIRFLQRPHRSRPVKVNQQDLEAVVAEIGAKKGRIVSYRISSKRHRGRLTVTTIITCTGGTLVQVRPPLFLPTPARS